MYDRAFNPKIADKQSFFLWGARQTGKCTLLKNLFKDYLSFDLLLSDVHSRFLNNLEQ
jgi:uncharacterized protein